MTSPVLGTVTTTCPRFTDTVRAVGGTAMRWRTRSVNGLMRITCPRTSTHSNPLYEETAIGARGEDATTVARVTVPWTLRTASSDPPAGVRSRAHALAGVAAN